jgi:FkbM family methyltransferase
LKPIYAGVMSVGQSVLDVPTGAGSLRWRVDALTSQQFILGTYEPYMQRAFTEYVRKGDVVYDVGAHAGYHTLFCSLLVGSTGRVCAFEPNPKNLASIEGQLSVNRANQISVFPYALGNRCGLAKLDTSHGASQGQLSDVGSVEVQVRTIDSLIASDRCPVPHLIKIDVEGHEAEVLAGAMNTLRVHKPIVLCDYNDDGTYKLVADMLGPLSYVVRNGPPVLALPLERIELSTTHE